MPTTPNVSVNLLWCRPGRVGGAEEYLVRQLLGLRSVAPDASVSLVVPPGFAEAHPELIQRFKTVVGSRWTATLPGRLVEEIRWLPRVVRDSAVIHHSNGTIPPRSPGPVVLTIHDLQYRRYPAYFSRTRLAYLRWMLPRSARRAVVITVPSEFVRQSVIDAFGIEPDRLLVVPHGFDPPNPEQLPSEDEVRTRFGLGRRRILVYPAATYPHKGHHFMLNLLARRIADEDLCLVLLGGAGRAEASVMAAIGSLGLSDRVVRTGRVSEGHRDALIRMADAVVFPSEFEGFGAPVLEAMALGTPVICSDQAALPEVVGDAGMVLPLDPDAWADAVQRLPDWRNEKVEQGHRRAREFSIRASGAALADAYRRAIRIDE